jgi:hypothetical protein
MCLPSCSWQTSSRRPRPERSIASFSPNSVLLIHHEFERGGGVSQRTSVAVHTMLRKNMYLNGRDVFDRQHCILIYGEKTVHSGHKLFKGVSLPERRGFSVCLSFSRIAILGVSGVVYRILFSFSFLWRVLIYLEHSLVG